MQDEPSQDAISPAAGEVQFSVSKIFVATSIFGVAFMFFQYASVLDARAYQTTNGSSQDAMVLNWMGASLFIGALAIFTHGWRGFVFGTAIAFLLILIPIMYGLLFMA